MKKALISGITGMDGSHLADLLLSKGYKVYGLERRDSLKQYRNINHILNDVELVPGDLYDQNSLTRAIKNSNPDEVYNLASPGAVKESWNYPEQTGEVVGLGVLRILESIREFNRDIKFYQASSSEMFGKMTTEIANEDTPFYPRSPYACAKVYGHWICKNYRESYNMFNCSGILFNHESERRGVEFLTRKITNGIAKIYSKKADYITLGNLDARRDWGYAPDYVEAMWKMMQKDEPDDYVVATGIVWSVKDFLRQAFSCIGISNWEDYVKQDERYMRPADIDVICGDYTKASLKLGWEPRTKIERIVELMVQNDIKLIEQGVIL